MNYLLEMGGENRDFISDIPMLQKLEERNGINLDDYIPYNEDYKKTLELEAILAKERNGLYFYRPIRKYMDYKIKIEDTSKAYLDHYEKALDRYNVIIGDYLNCEGTRGDLCKHLSQIMSVKNANKVIDNISLINKAGIIKDDIEFVTVRSRIDRKHQEGRQFVYAPKYVDYYNIRISALTLISIAAILDIKVTLGLASAGLMIIGVDGKPIVKLDTYNAEVCLIMEALQNKVHIIDENVLDDFNHKCVHNDLNCRYRNDDECSIKKNDINSILEHLCQNYIFKKIGEMYKYCF